jgi:hypothetical protein
MLKLSQRDAAHPPQRFISPQVDVLHACLLGDAQHFDRDADFLTSPLLIAPSNRQHRAFVLHVIGEVRDFRYRAAPAALRLVLYKRRWKRQDCGRHDSSSMLSPAAGPHPPAGACFSLIAQRQRQGLCPVAPAICSIASNSSSGSTISQDR